MEEKPIRLQKRMKMRHRYPYPWNLAFDVITHPDKDYENQTELYEVYIPKFLECVNQLNEREQTIIHYRFAELRTCEECQKLLHITRERVRQIESKAIRKLKCKKCQFLVGSIIKSLEEKNEETDQQSGYKNSHGKTIDHMELSIRSYNALKRGGINYIDDLRECSLMDLQNLRNMGIKSLHEVIDKAAQYGIKYEWQ